MKKTQMENNTALMNEIHHPADLNVSGDGGVIAAIWFHFYFFHAEQMSTHFHSINESNNKVIFHFN